MASSSSSSSSAAVPAPSASSSASSTSSTSSTASTASTMDNLLIHEISQEFQHLQALLHQHLPYPRVIHLEAAVERAHKLLRTLLDNKSNHESEALARAIEDFLNKQFGLMKQTILTRYTHIRKLFKTTYGGLYLGRDNFTNTPVALKFSFKKNIGKTSSEDPIGDSAMLFRLNMPHQHQNILQLFDAYHDHMQGFYVQVMEHLPNGELLDFINKLRNSCSLLSEDRVRHYFSAIVRGVHHVHSCGICHLDLSPENIMFNSFNVPIIIDFGCARSLGHFTPRHTPMGKPKCRTPEMEVGVPCDGASCDCYSLGIILYLLLTTNYPYGSIGDECFEWIYTHGQLVLPGRSSAVCQLILGLICPESNRLTVSQVLQHSWMQPSIATSPLTSTAAAAAAAASHS